MIAIRKAGEPGHTNLDWRNPRCAFSFADYHAPRHTGFHRLRVINDDLIAGGGAARSGENELNLESTGEAQAFLFDWN